MKAAMALAALIGAAMPVHWDGPKDPAVSEWFQAQRVPGSSNLSCCDNADGRFVQARISGDHWEALILRKDFGDTSGAPDGWVSVPPEVILHSPTPTGEAVAWWWDGHVRCFAPPTEA